MMTDTEQSKIFRFYLFCAAIYFTQATGTTGGLAGTMIAFFFKEGLGMTATTMAYIGAITSLAWWIKPGFGLLSDFVPIRDYRRKSYIYICNSISVLLWLSLAGMAWAGVITTYWPIAIVSMAMGFCFAMTDVVADGLMVQTGQKYDKTGAFQAVQWSTIRLAIMLTAVLGAVLANWVMPDTGKATFEITTTIYYRMGLIFLVAAGFPLLNIFAAWRWTDEEKMIANPENLAKIKAGVKRAVRMKRVWILAICIFGLQFSPSAGTPFFFYIRDYCGPEHGQMTKMTLAWLSTFESGIGILGCLAYWRWGKLVDIKKLLYFSIFLGFVTSFLYLWVKSVITLYIFAAMFGPIGAFIFLAFMDIAAKNCPKLAEGFVFAGLCAIMNIASSASGAFGGWMFKLLNTDGGWYDWGWSYTGWLTNWGVSPHMVGLRPLIVIGAFFTLATLIFIPLMRLDPQGYMRIEE